MGLVLSIGIHTSVGSIYGYPSKLYQLENYMIIKYLIFRNHKTLFTHKCCIRWDQPVFLFLTIVLYSHRNVFFLIGDTRAELINFQLKRYANKHKFMQCGH